MIPFEQSLHIVGLGLGQQHIGKPPAFGTGSFQQNRITGSYHHNGHATQVLAQPGIHHLVHGHFLANPCSVNHRYLGFIAAAHRGIR